MTELMSEKRTRSDKFPLTLHKTGQFCKKIKGKIYYFGTDRQKALDRYLEQAASPHAGRPVSHSPTAEQLSMKTMCHLYLDHQESRVAVGEVKPRRLSDQVSLLKAFVRSVGPHRMVSDVSTLDLQNYRTRLIGAKSSPNTI
ncbi:MAG TPA: hypothetical protein VLH56_14505, partial [Dissulfurispiraceae bacterium]|nr:hypothetical protein [Dissulfurispiraceae bacterium]